jgi:predicted Zn-dependent protease
LLLAGELGSRADEVAGMFGVGLVYGVILPYSRAHELEADRLGVRLMAEAGYDPRAAENFWKRMIDLDRDRPQRLALLSTHPADDARLSALRVEIERFSTPEARQDVARSTL